MTNIPAGGVLLGKPEPEALTLDHPVFAEIAQAIQELLRRTDLLANTLADVAAIMVAEGLIPGPDGEPEPSLDEQVAAAGIDTSDLSPAKPSWDEISTAGV